MKRLPEKVAIDKAIHGQRLYKGTVKIQQMSRLLDLLASSKGDVKFSLQFAKAARILGKAQVKISADLPLVCTISHKEFIFPVKIDATIGFIDDLEYEDMLDVDMEASWVEDGFIKPLEIIEDELILAVPDAPFAEDSNGISVISVISENKTSDDKVVESTSVKPNPFAVLKDLKK